MANPTSEEYEAYLQTFEHKRRKRCTHPKPYDFLGNEIKQGGWVVFPTQRRKDIRESRSTAIVLSIRYVVRVFRDGVWIIDRGGRRPVRVPGSKLVYVGDDYPNQPSNDEVISQIKTMREEIEKMNAEVVEAINEEESEK